MSGFSTGKQRAFLLDEGSPTSWVAQRQGNSAMRTLPSPEDRCGLGLEYWRQHCRISWSALASQPLCLHTEIHPVTRLWREAAGKEEMIEALISHTRKCVSTTGSWEAKSSGDTHHTEKLPEEQCVDIFEVLFLEGEAGGWGEDAPSSVYVLSVHWFCCLKLIYALAQNYYFV